MELRHLATLVAVAEHGTFTAAAGALHTVQSNVSTQIARLEREVGAVLVDRHSGRLTAEGEAVLSRARRVLGELDAMTSDVVAVRADVSGEVRIGVIATTARWLTPLLLTTLEERHPGIHPVIVEASTTSLSLQLTSGRLDLAVANLPIPEPEIVGSELFEEDLVLAVPSKHPLASRTKISLRELADIEVLLPARGTNLRDELEAAAVAAGVKLRAQAEIDGPSLIASLVVSGRGAAVLPVTALRSETGRRWRLLSLTGMPPRRVGLAVRRYGLPSAAARAVTAVLQDLIATRAGSVPGVRPAAS